MSTASTVSSTRSENSVQSTTHGSSTPTSPVTPSTTPASASGTTALPSTPAGSDGQRTPTNTSPDDSTPVDHHNPDPTQTNHCPDDVPPDLRDLFCPVLSPDDLITKTLTGMSALLPTDPVLDFPSDIVDGPTGVLRMGPAVDPPAASQSASSAVYDGSSDVVTSVFDAIMTTFAGAPSMTTSHAQGSDASHDSGPPATTALSVSSTEPLPGYPSGKANALPTPISGDVIPNSSDSNSSAGNHASTYVYIIVGIVGFIIICLSSVYAIMIWRAVRRKRPRPELDRAKELEEDKQVYPMAELGPRPSISTDQQDSLRGIKVTHSDIASQRGTASHSQV